MSWQVCQSYPFSDCVLHGDIDHDSCSSVEPSLWLTHSWADSGCSGCVRMCEQMHISYSMAPSLLGLWDERGSGMSYASSSHFLDPVWPKGVVQSTVERNSLPCPPLPKPRDSFRHFSKRLSMNSQKGHACLKKVLWNLPLNKEQDTIKCQSKPR